MSQLVPQLVMAATLHGLPGVEDALDRCAQPLRRMAFIRRTIDVLIRRLR